MRELPASALRAVRGVLTDIDDTLTRDGAIEPAALHALQRLAQMRLPTIAITGRPAGWSETFAMDWPVAAIVAENGAVMLRRVGDALRRDFVQDKATRAANFGRLQQCAQAVLAAVPQARLARDSGGRLTDIAVDHSEFARLDAQGIDAVLGVMHAHGLRASVSSIHVNGWIGTHDKWSGARWAVQQALGSMQAALRGTGNVKVPALIIAGTVLVGLVMPRSLPRPRGPNKCKGEVCLTRSAFIPSMGVCALVRSKGIRSLLPAVAGSPQPLMRGRSP